MTDFTTMVTSLTSKKATPIPTSVQSKSSGTYSVNIVCAHGNRKSITLTKKLAERLMLDSNVYITVYGDDGYIALSATPINKYSVLYSFSNEKDRIIYNSSLVYFLVETFDLDYVHSTSHSFNDIIFSTIENTTTAMVRLKAPDNSTSSPIPMDEQESVDENNV